MPYNSGVRIYKKCGAHDPDGGSPSESFRTNHFLLLFGGGKGEKSLSSSPLLLLSRLLLLLESVSPAIFVLSSLAWGVDNLPSTPLLLLVVLPPLPLLCCCYAAANKGK